MGDMDQGRNPSAASMARLGLWDAVSLIVGIIVGVGIFETTSDIFQQAPGPWVVLGVWLLGGLLALIGAFCFAELASTYPRSGGEYVYLTKAFGSGTGFSFAWAQLALIRPTNIAALAFIFSDRARAVWNLDFAAQLTVACLAVLIPTIINILGVTLGKHTQNLLTILKLLGLAAMIVAGFALGDPQPAAAAVGAGTANWFSVCMIFVLWTYSGSQEAAYIAAEVRNNRRNLPLALLLGTGIVTAVYLLVNGALWLGLGYAGAQANDAPANLVGLLLPRVGPTALNVLVMVSALGAINGMVFTTARIFTEFGADHRLFGPLSHWSRRLATPARSLAVEGFITIGFILGVGLLGSGRNSFNATVAVSAAAYWFFMLMTGLALYRLRALDPVSPRPFRVPGYPVVPFLFCLWCAFMVWGAFGYDFKLSLLGLTLVATGLPLYFLPRKLRRPEKLPALVTSLRGESARETCANP